MMKAIKYEKDAVLIQDGKIKAWIDVWIDNEDIICDWNQNDFVLTDPNDVASKNWQDNLEHFEDATTIAREVLENAGIIYQDENGRVASNRKISHHKRFYYDRINLYGTYSNPLSFCLLDFKIKPIAS